MATENPTGNRARLEAHRHAELVESLWRVSTGIEALYQQGERRLKATTALEAKVESALRYFIEAWQSVRPRRKTGGRP